MRRRCCACRRKGRSAEGVRYRPASGLTGGGQRRPHLASHGLQLVSRHAVRLQHINPSVKRGERMQGEEEEEKLIPVPLQADR